MSLEKKVTQDKIEAINTGSFSVLQVRTKTAIIEDGTELSSSYHRHVVAPTDDLSNESDEVVAIANAVFTQEMKDAYTASQESAE
ncbi:MAG: hypothetical protein ACSHXL_01485 [Bacteroidota bacterium]